MSKSVLSEAMIQRQILDYLAALHIFAMRMNSGTQVIKDRAHRRVIRMHEPGTADILAFPHDEDRAYEWNRYPVVLWIEVKSATGKQTPVQKSFQRQVEAEGHQYAICRSISDVEEALR
jgi:hypothetical protein